jgi:hypothetical protein
MLENNVFLRTVWKLAKSWVLKPKKRVKKDIYQKSKEKEEISSLIKRQMLDENFLS